jgi:hypothetical protein
MREFFFFFFFVEYNKNCAWNSVKVRRVISVIGRGGVCVRPPVRGI